MNQNEPADDVPEEIRQHPAWRRLQDQLSWYDRRSRQNQRRFRVIRIVQIILATAIPIISLAPFPGDDSWTQWTTAACGAIIAIAESIQHLYQHAALWIEYRSTAEYLKHEKYLFLSNAGPYRDLQREQSLTLLAERVEQHVSTEHAHWIPTAKHGVRASKPSAS